MRKPALLLALFLAAACGDELDGTPCTASTDPGEACGSNAICETAPGSTSGTCRELVACDSNGGCPDGEGLCNNGFFSSLDTMVCLPFVCADNSDCREGTHCDTESGTMGACVDDDGGSDRCLSDADCDAGLSCVMPSDNADYKVCRDNGLNPDGTCDADYQCEASQYCSYSTSHCIDGSGDYCTGNEQCLGGEICDPADGVCRRP